MITPEAHDAALNYLAGRLRQAELSLAVVIGENVRKDKEIETLSQSLTDLARKQELEDEMKTIQSEVDSDR